MFFTRHAGIKAGIVSVLVCALTSGFSQQRTTNTLPASVPLLSLLSAISVSEAAPFSNNDWTALGRTGLTYQVGGKHNEFRWADARITSLRGTYRVTYSSVNAKIDSLRIESTGAQKNIGYTSFAALLSQLLGVDTSIKTVRGKCAEETGLDGSIVLSITTKGTKPIFGFITDMNDDVSGKMIETIQFTNAYDSFAWKCGDQ